MALRSKLGHAKFYDISIDGNIVKMHATTLSSKYQISIPKKTREIMGLQAGQRFAVIVKGSIIELVPIGDIPKARGMLKGADTQDYRDRQDRI